MLKTNSGTVGEKFRCKISVNFRENKGRNSVNFALISFAQYCTVLMYKLFH